MCEERVLIVILRRPCAKKAVSMPNVKAQISNECQVKNEKNDSSNTPNLARLSEDTRNWFFETILTLGFWI